ncbi:serine protease [Mycobacterium sp.]|uniref:serine protease n=1 Tax=Mycobacterium sp. TaxID=1785 RepID=UPI0031DDE4D8
MRAGYRWWVGVCVFVLLLAVVCAPAASAALPLGGGAGIVVGGTYCTLTTIGHDKTGGLVGFTAASCGGPDSPVVAEGSESLGPVGTVVAIPNDPGLRYAVIKFDSAKITPIPNFAGFVINGIDTRPFEWHQPLCRLGAATGDSCGRIGSLPFGGRRISMGGGAYQPGDNGGPATSDGLLLGLITGGQFVPPDLQGSPPHQFTEMMLFSAVLDDVNSAGGPGAGFIPIPA